MTYMIVPYITMPAARDAAYEWYLDEPELSKYLDDGNRPPRSVPAGPVQWEIDGEVMDKLMDMDALIWRPMYASEPDYFIVLDEEAEDYLLVWAKHHHTEVTLTLQRMRHLREVLDFDDLMWRVFKL